MDASASINNDSNNTSDSNVMIRHSGKALIRGKIRRVWRPRFLELDDNGLVHYYEVHKDSSSVVETEDNNNNDNDDSKSLKCTLQIYFARIIDVTTLRDVHVGLPMGSFGFLFCGQRLDVLSTTTTNASTSSMEACHPSLEHNVQAPRDFLCAVSTLEEAQSWVVALQWAASERKRMEDQDWQDDEDFHTNAVALHSTHVGRSNNAFQVVMSRTSSMTTATTTARTSEALRSSSRKPKYARKAPAREKHSKTVVTKVQSLRLVRTKAWKFEWAYCICMLVLRSSNANNATTITSSSSSKQDAAESAAVDVEERILLRTLDDIQSMLDDLDKEVKHHHEKSRRVLKQLKLPKLDDCHRAFSCYADFLESVPQVDRILRTLAMDPNICNSQSMRSFWSLSTTTGPTLASGDRTSPTTTNSSCRKRSSFLPMLLTAHDPTALTGRKQLEPPENTKEFVQEWLQINVASKVTSDMEVLACSVLVWLLQRPALVTASFVFLVWLFPPMVQLYQSYMVSTSIRVDVLLFSWIAAAFLGREYQRREVSSQGMPFRRAAPSHPSTDTLLLEEDESSLSIIDMHSITSEEEGELEEEALLDDEQHSKNISGVLSSPLPEHPGNGGLSSWSRPENDIFRVRGATYLQDRIKVPSAPPPFDCRGVDIWLTDNPERHISRHPSVLGGKLKEQDTFVVNFLLPFGNFVAYFSIPPIDKFPCSKLANVWTKFLEGDQQYRDARLKLLPVVVDGPWIVRAAVGPGTSPALLGKVIPLQYYFSSPSPDENGIYEVDVIITASRIAKGILNVVSGQSKLLTMAFAFIIEASLEEELPETVLCTFQMHSIHLEDCPPLPVCNLDDIESAS